MTKPIGDAIFNVDTVASYLYHLKPDISPLKLQKSLYFLFAYHGAVYAQGTGEGVFEGTLGSPKYLFDAQFEAWQYGPVIRSVYFKDRDNEYSDPEKVMDSVSRISAEPECQKFIDELFEQINAVSDFKLVDRSHEDDVWKRAYEPGKSNVMDNEEIITEYVEKYV